MAITNVPSAVTQESPAAVRGKSEPVSTASPSTSPTATAAAPSTATPSTAQVQQAMHEIRRAVEPVTNDLEFSVDEQSGKTVIRVVDKTTQELIRQIPTEEVMAIARQINQQAGSLVKTQA